MLPSRIGAHTTPLQPGDRCSTGHSVPSVQARVATQLGANPSRQTERPARYARLCPQLARAEGELMARIYLRKTLRGFEPADDAGVVLHHKYKLNEVYRADIVKPRSYQHHKLCMALLTMTYNNLPEKYAKCFASFDQFRYAVAEESGHVEAYVTLQGEVKTKPASISYDAIPDDVEFGRVMAAMMTVCAKILDMAESRLAGEVSRYADEHYGSAA